MLHFWIDFAKTLFHANEGELYPIIDEAQNFAPKGSLKSIEGQGGTSLHWTNRLLAEGRGLGINIWVCSQRPQKVHNDTLDGCETLVAMRVVHPAARAAIKDWIEGAEDKASGKEVLDKVGEMKRGDAIIWSPEIGFGPKHVSFPMFKTFDSFAPPQLQKKVSQKGWADVDLDAVKEKLASVIKEAKANNPKELRKELNEVRKQLRIEKDIGLRLEKRPTETQTRPAVSPEVEKRQKRIEGSHEIPNQNHQHKFFRPDAKGGVESDPRSGEQRRRQDRGASNGECKNAPRFRERRSIASGEADEIPRHGGSDRGRSPQTKPVRGSMLG